MKNNSKTPDTSTGKITLIVVEITPQTRDLIYDLYTIADRAYIVSQDKVRGFISKLGVFPEPQEGGGER